jgi:hypothetical protein
VVFGDVGGKILTGRSCALICLGEKLDESELSDYRC